MAVDASPAMKPWLPSWNGRQACSGVPSWASTLRASKWTAFSGVVDRSVPLTMTSVANPLMIHCRARITPSAPEAHAAPTFIDGPVKPYSAMNIEGAVDGSSWR
jgi:hypothetical protein